MSSGTVRGADAKAFVKCFNSICQWNNGWDRWNDMVNLFAIEIANAVDWNHRDSRNETYKRIASKYSPEEFARFGELFTILVESLERNPFQDFLGGMYMELDMGSKARGQCFTPFGVCEAMAAMAMPKEVVKRQIEERGWISINDCACGAGATLIAAAKHLHLMDVNFQQSALFVAQDLDNTVAMMCYIQMSLIGCAGRVRIGDTLTNPDVGDILLGDGSANTWYMPMFYSYPWQGRITARWLDRLLGVRKPVPAQAETGTSENPPDELKAQESAPERTEPARNVEKTTGIYQETANNAQEVGKIAQKTELMPELLTAKKTRKSMSEGQLMFDLTGGM